MQLKELMSGSMINPFNIEDSEGILRQFIHYMHPNGQYLKADEVEPVSKFPIIKQQSVIFIRQRIRAVA